MVGLGLHTVSNQEGSPLFNGNGFLDSALDGVVRTITVAKPPGPFPLPGTRIKEHQSHDISTVFEHCQATGHNINPHNVKVLPDENSTIKRRLKEAIAIKQRNPPWLWMRDWTYHQFTILSWGFVTFLSGNLSRHNADGIWVIRTKNDSFRFSFFRSEFWNFLH